MKQSELSKLRSQAVKILKSQQSWGTSRGESKRRDSTSPGIHSVRTWNESVNALAFAAHEMGVSRIKEIDVHKSILYLTNRVKLGLTDKAISRDRMALERYLGRRLPCYQDLQKISQEPSLIKKWISRSIDFIHKLPGDPNTPLGKRTQKNSPLPEHERNAGVGGRRTSSSRPGTHARLRDISRAYADHQIKEIATSFESESERLSILLMRDAGLRVHELFTLRRVGEGKPRSNQRDWRNDLHSFRDGVKYIVTGKGGLTREVVISHALAERLEKQRLPKPRKIKDRKVTYRQRYNLTGGNNLSKRFMTASKRELGFSLGAHGARHSYAQSRLALLMSKGIPEKDAKHIVSQELGHMRVGITNVYLR